MEMHQVRYFLAAAHALSFTRAAEACHVSQPALTAAMKKLEGELGGPLFFRESNRLKLTEFGRQMSRCWRRSWSAPRRRRARPSDFACCSSSRCGSA